METYGGEKKAELVMARQGAKAKKAMKKWGPLMKYLGEKNSLSTYLMIEKDPSKLIKSIKNKEVDLIIDTFYQFIVLDTEQNFNFRMNMWRKGVQNYSGCLVSAKENKISINDLEGKKIVFEDPYSTGSFALPMTELSKNGYLDKLYYKNGTNLKKSTNAKTAREAIANHKVEKGKVFYTFSNDDSTSYLWLKKGYIDVVGASCKILKEHPDLRLVAKSVAIPRAIVATHKEMKSDLEKSIISNLLELKEQDKIMQACGRCKKASILSAEELQLIDNLRPVLSNIYLKSKNDMKQEMKLTH